MKKILTLVLVVAMVATLAVTAFADKIGPVAALDATSKSVGEITITNTVDNSATTKVYAVEVKWTNTALTADTVISGATWDPENHKWTSGTTTTTWTNDTVTVTVTNHSNAEVKATLTAPSATEGVEFATPSGTELVCADASKVALDAPTATNLDNTKVFTIVASGNTAATSITVEATVTLTAN